MTVTITPKGVLLAVIAVLVIVLLIYLIILIRKLIETMKKVDVVLDDAKTISSVAADKTKRIDDIVDGIGDSVGTVVKSLKGNRSIVSAATSIVNAASNLTGQIKKSRKKK